MVGIRLGIGCSQKKEYAKQQYHSVLLQKRNCNKTISSHIVIVKLGYYCFVFFSNFIYLNCSIKAINVFSIFYKIVVIVLFFFCQDRSWENVICVNIFNKSTIRIVNKFKTPKLIVKIIRGIIIWIYFFINLN